LWYIVVTHELLSGSRFEELEKRVSDYVDRFVSMRGRAIILSNCPRLIVNNYRAHPFP